MARQETLPARRAPEAPAPAKATAQSDFRALIEGSAQRLAEVIPAMMRRHLTPARIIRLSLATYSRKPELRECEPLSILNCIVQAAQLGFEADGPLGHAYLVPYNEKVKNSRPERWIKVCSLQVGYKGFADLARRTAGYDLIDSRLVYKEDAFDLAYNPSPIVRHVPDLSGDPGEILHAYAYAYLKGSDRPIFELMTRKELLKVRNSSRSKDSPAWVNWEGEMFKKIAMKRMLKDQPLSVELADALAYDNEVNAVEASGPRAPAPRGMAGLRERLQLGSPPAPEPEFAASEGVAVPLRTEADDSDVVPDEFTEGPEAREPGEDG